jgi:hypothetical protein
VTVSRYESLVAESEGSAPLMPKFSVGHGLQLSSSNIYSTDKQQFILEFGSNFRSKEEESRNLRNAKRTEERREKLRKTKSVRNAEET